MTSPTKRKRKDIPDEWFSAYDCITDARGDEKKLRDIVLDIFMQLEYIQRIDKKAKDALISFIEAIQSRYNKNPYHCFEHAIHVLCNANILLRDVTSPLFTDLERLALLFSALIHDVDHLGVSNSSLVASSHPYALLYNDRNVAEMRSLTLAFELLETSEDNFYTRLLPQDKFLFRKLVIDIVLATDIADKLEEKRFLADLDSEISTCGEGLDYNKASHRAYALIMMMKISDIGASLQNIETCRVWSERFFVEISHGASVNIAEFLRLQTAHISHGVNTTVVYMQKMRLLSDEFASSIMCNLDAVKMFWESEQGNALLLHWEASNH
jgi:hypothetical protein